MKLNFRKYWKAYLISFIIALVVGMIPFLIVYFNHLRGLLGAVDGCTVAMVVLLGIGGLMFVAYEGFFDFVSYGFKQMASSKFSKKANENNDFPGYKEAKREKRIERPKLFLSVLACGLLFLIVMIILRIIMAAM